jgi:hypothetical protein
MAETRKALPRTSIVERTGAPMFDGQYQMGFITSDIEAAQERLAARFGIAKYRVKCDPQAIWSAHAFAGDMMIEIVQPGPQAPPVFIEDRRGEGAVRLHHLGYLVRTRERFDEIAAIVEREGWLTPLRTTAMDGHLQVIFVDARADLGYYQEYVFLTGPALGLYGDVPVN